MKIPENNWSRGVNRRRKKLVGMLRLSLDESAQKSVPSLMALRE
ncbi:hypothetical protein V4B17_05775 [Bartonella sp. B23]